MKECFLQLDTDRSGWLSHAELVLGLSDAIGEWSNWCKDFQDLIDQLDTNGDGKIDYAEFITAAVNRAQILSKENLDIVFKIFDSDNNGTISVQELKAVF